MKTAHLDRLPVIGAKRQRLLYRISWLLCSTLLAGSLSGCGVNTIPTYDEQVKAAWAQVQNEYQRRADLVPNLVQTVKGYAKHERETLTAVTKARAAATSVHVDADTINNPKKLARYQQAQGQLSGALGRLLAVSERYPDLKSSQNFLALQSQLEGTENRIAVARRDYILAVQRYNTELRTFPGVIWHKIFYSGMQPHANFKATSAHANQAPKVQF